jgi:uncharacterized repeat protein (TIGR03803 family)
MKVSQLIPCWLLVTPLLASAELPPPGLPNEIVPEVLHGFKSAPQQFNEGLIPGGGGNFYGISPYGGANGAGCIFQVTPGGVLTEFASFGDTAGGARGVTPVGKLAFDGVDKYYGVTLEGGRFYVGTVFRMNSAGTVETLVDLSYGGTASAPSPATGLTRGTDGKYYGASIYSGGDGEDFGSVFRVSPAGGFQVLARFTGTKGPLPGSYPDGQMAARPDGSLIGTARSGGKFGFGTIFRVNPNGTVSHVADFTGATGALRGAGPEGPVGVTANGTTYGVTIGFDPATPEGIWRMPLNGPPQRIASYGSLGTTQDLSSLAGGVATDAAGNAIITISSSDTDPLGGIYSVTPAGATTLKAGFSALLSGSNYYYANRGPSSDGAGGFIGTTDFVVYRVNASDVISTFTQIDEDGDRDDGNTVITQALFAPDGTLFGRTEKGSDNHTGSFFKLPPSGPLSRLFATAEDFLSFNVFQSDQLALDPNGFIISQDGGFDAIIFSLDPSTGSTSPLASFPVDRPLSTLANPSGGLTPDGLGAFYGVVQDELKDSPFTQQPAVYRLTSSTIEFVADLGADASIVSPLARTLAGDFLAVDSGDFGINLGRILRVTPAGVVSTLADFGAPSNQTKATRPVGPALIEPSGNALLFTDGFSDDGGLPSAVRVTPAGQITRAGLLPGNSGLDEQIIASPLGPAALDPQGRIYGVGSFGGSNDSIGGIFRIETTGESSVIYGFRFDGSSTGIGGRPRAGLVKGPDGAIYGSTTISGRGGGGTLFRFFTTEAGASLTLPPGSVEARRAIFTGQITDNGYPGEYWFEYGADPLALDSSTEHITFGGFNGTENAAQTVTGLKGHRTYYVRLKVRIGATIVDGPVVMFQTPNGPPTAENDAMLSESPLGPFNARVLENDADLDGDSVTIESFTQPQFGTVAVVDDVFTYTPGAGFEGKDSFTYTINDGLTLTATATVQILTTSQTAGEYAGLIFDEADFDALMAPRPAPRFGAAGLPAIVPGTPKSRGFIDIFLTGRRDYTVKFDVDGKSYALKQQLELEKPSNFRQTKGGELVGTFVPGDTGISGRITLGNRTIIFRAARSFAALGIQRAQTSFTARLEPTEEASPVNSSVPIPAGNGFALIRVSKKGKTSMAGVLPDGTPFTGGSVIDGEDRFPFLARLYKKKKGSYEGELKVVDAGDVDDSPGRRTRWFRPADAKEKRFPGGIDTALKAFGSKFTPPSGNATPLDLGGGNRVTARFRRGGLFDEKASVFEIDGKKEKVVGTLDEALASLDFKSKAGFFKGSIRTSETGKKPVSFRGIFTQRDNSGSGFFLGPADGGRVIVEVGG